MPEKRCPRCEVTQSTDAFYYLPSTAKLSAYCKECSKTLSKEWTKQNRAKAYAADQGARDRRLGVDSQWRVDTLKAQGGGCAVCGATVSGGQGTFHLDHDHETGAVRGLLCHGCNTGIGNLRDDPALLRAAAAYVEDHRANPRDWSAYQPIDRRYRGRLACAKGHPYTPENVRNTQAGGRECLTCRKAKLARRAKQYRAKREGAKPS